MEMYPQCEPPSSQSQGQSKTKTTSTSARSSLEPSPMPSFGCESNASSPSREDSSLLNNDGDPNAEQNRTQHQTLQQTLTNAANAVRAQVGLATAEPVAKVMETLEAIQRAHGRHGHKCAATDSDCDSQHDGAGDSGGGDDGDGADRQREKSQKQTQKQKVASRSRTCCLCGCLEQCSWALVVYMLAALATGVLLATCLYVPLLMRMRAELAAQHEDRVPELLVRIDELKLDLRHMQRLVQNSLVDGRLRVGAANGSFGDLFVDALNFTEIDIAINDPTDANARLVYDTLAPLRDAPCFERDAAFQMRLAIGQYFMGHLEGARSEPIRRRYFLDANATLTRALHYDTHNNNSLLLRWCALPLLKYECFLSDS